MDIFGNDTLSYIYVAHVGKVGAVFNGSMWVILLDCPMVYTLKAMLMSFWYEYLNSSQFELPFIFTAGYPVNVSPIVSATDIFNMSSVIQQDGNYSYTDGNNTDNDRLMGEVCFAQEYDRVPVVVISSCCAIVMLISHVIIALIGYLDKEIVSPIFITLQSFSIVSIVDGFFCWWHVSLPCLQYEGDTAISCAVWLGIMKYFESCIYYHLLLLSSLRIYTTLYPLQCQANVTKTRTRYILCGIYLFNLVATPLYVQLMYTYDGNCNRLTDSSEAAEAAGLGDMLIYVSQSEEFPLFVLSVIVIVLFIIGMLVSFVTSRLSTARLQSSSQRQQSRLASIIIILFLVIYWPGAIIKVFVSTRCNNSIAMKHISTITNSIKLLFHTVSPFILCLRLKSVRQTLKAASCQTCTGQ